MERCEGEYAFPTRCRSDQKGESNVVLRHWLGFSLPTKELMWYCTCGREAILSFHQHPTLYLSESTFSDSCLHITSFLMHVVPTYSYLKIKLTETSSILSKTHPNRLSATRICKVHTTLHLFDLCLLSQEDMRVWKSLILSFSTRGQHLSRCIVNGGWISFTHQNIESVCYLHGFSGITWQAPRHLFPSLHLTWASLIC